MTDLAPSAVRKIILADHEQLRAKLKGIEAVIESRSYSGLSKLLQEFTQLFLSHIDNEERILRPVLRDLDAWGAVRVDRMNKEHAVQREEIRVLDLLVAANRPEEYLEPVKKFIEEVYRDMNAEEQECLHPDVLKDDLIPVGGTSS